MCNYAQITHLGSTTQLCPLSFHRCFVIHICLWVFRILNKYFFCRMYVCAFVDVWMCGCVHACMFVRACMCLYVCVHVWMCACMYVCACMHACVCVLCTHQDHHLLVSGLYQVRLYCLSQFLQNEINILYCVFILREITTFDMDACHICTTVIYVANRIST
jgi:hypothetical protein